MCSTPFGITAVNTRRPAPRRGRHPVLNAFRHHCGQHRLVVDLRPFLLRCSTPFGITAVNTSNSSAMIVAPKWCSTPFGITAVNTRGGASYHGPNSRAQRLSASLRSTRRGPRTCSTFRRVLNAFRHHCGQHSTCEASMPRLSMCSTPFGITAVNTRRRRSGRRQTGCAQRLSASLRSTRPGPRPSTPVPRGAQRLSASLRSTLGTWGYIAAAAIPCSTPFGITAVNTSGVCGGKVAHFCAQRLSASLRSTPDRDRSRRREGVVLNAFRHHCGQHNAADERAAADGMVLNAFRHHCGQHVVRSVAGSSARRCSTPFGITAVNTRSTSASSSAKTSAQRLSASLRSTPRAVRIQSVDIVRAQRLSASLRSTPRWPRPARPGRRVLNAFRHHCGQHVARAREPRGVWSAQRLSASLRSTRRGHVGTAGQRVCSTPFGITAVNTVGSLRGGAHHSSAQRLSASLRSTRGDRSHAARHLAAVLNAFRHHCGQHSENERLHPRARMCSTPFGITAVNTSLLGGCGAAFPSAQRLSASLRSTRKRRSC